MFTTHVDTARETHRVYQVMCCRLYTHGISLQRPVHAIVVGLGKLPNRFSKLLKASNQTQNHAITYTVKVVSPTLFVTVGDRNNS